MKKEKLVREEYPGISKFLTQEAGWWGEFIDSLTPEQMVQVAEVLPDPYCEMRGQDVDGDISVSKTEEEGSIPSVPA